MLTRLFTRWYKDGRSLPSPSLSLSLIVPAKQQRRPGDLSSSTLVPDARLVGKLVLRTRHHLLVANRRPPSLLALNRLVSSAWRAASPSLSLLSPLVTLSSPRPRGRGSIPVTWCVSTPSVEKKTRWGRRAR